MHIVITLRMLLKVLDCYMKTPWWCPASNFEPSPIALAIVHSNVCAYNVHRWCNFDFAPTFCRKMICHGETCLQTRQWWWKDMPDEGTKLLLGPATRSPARSDGLPTGCRTRKFEKIKQDQDNRELIVGNPHSFKGRARALSLSVTAPCSYLVNFFWLS